MRENCKYNCVSEVTSMNCKLSSPTWKMAPLISVCERKLPQERQVNLRGTILKNVCGSQMFDRSTKI